MRWEFRPRKVLHVHRNSVLCCDSQQDFLSSCEQRDAAGGDGDGAFIGLAREGAASAAARARPVRRLRKRRPGVGCEWPDVSAVAG